MLIAELFIPTPGQVAILLVGSAVAIAPLAWWLARRDRQPPEGPGGPRP